MVEQLIQYEDNHWLQEDFTNTSYDTDNELSYHHRESSALDGVDWNDMTRMVQNMDSIPGMSLADRQQAAYHKKNLLSIRRKLDKEKLIVRTIYKGYSSYIGSTIKFQEKASKYMHQMGIYMFIDNVNPRNPTVSQQHLKTIVKQVERTLKDLLSSKSISHRQCILMYPNLSYVQLNYLYFVPDTSKDDIPLHPIIICKNGPTMNVTCYLNRLLWSMFNHITGCKTYLNGDDIVYDLEQYVKNGYLQETTHFVTFNINNICTRFSHEMAINALEKFLRIHRSKLETIVDEGLSNETIIQLVRLVLQNQLFIYENKLYRQVYGGVSGSLLTIPLACIYLFYGHQSLSMINTIIQNENKLLFGRCRDDFFLTWNNSKDTFLTLFNEIMISEQHSTTKPSLPLTPTIGSSIHLLDLEISHYEGQLHTKIYHDSMNDNHDLPNTFDFHKYQTSNLLKAALKHAVQCCSNEKDFNDERRYLDLCHLLHGISPDFISKCINEFYNEFGIRTNTYVLFPIIPYETLRRRVFDNYEQQIALKKQEHNAKPNIIRIPYPNDWDAQMAVNIKNDLLNIVNDGSNNKEIFDDIEIEMIPRPQTPLKINDCLINKRPPLRLLTLPPPNDASH